MLRRIATGISLLTLVACGGPSAAEQTQTVVQQTQVIIDQTQVVVKETETALANCKTEALAYQDAIEPITDEWADMLKVTEKTARMALAGQINELQSVKREADKVKPPSCAQEAHDHLIRSMEYSIDAYLAFLGQETEMTVYRQLAMGQSQMNSFTDKLAIATSGVQPTPTAIPNYDALLALKTQDLKDLLWQSSDVYKQKEGSTKTPFSGEIDGVTIELLNKKDFRIGSASIALYNNADEASAAVLKGAEQLEFPIIQKDLGNISFLTVGVGKGDTYLIARCNVAVHFIIAPGYIVEAQDYAEAIDTRIQAKCSQ